MARFRPYGSETCHRVAHDQVGAGQQQDDAGDPRRAEGRLLEPQDPQPVDDHRRRQLARDRGRRNAAGADRADRDQGHGHVGGAEHATEQVVPAHVEGRGEPARLPDQGDDQGQQQGPDRERDQGGRKVAGGAAEAGVDRRLERDQAADRGGEQHGEASVHRRGMLVRRPSSVGCPDGPSVILAASRCCPRGPPLNPDGGSAVDPIGRLRMRMPTPPSAAPLAGLALRCQPDSRLVRLSREGHAARLRGDRPPLPGAPGLLRGSDRSRRSGRGRGPGGACQGPRCPGGKRVRGQAQALALHDRSQPGAQRPARRADSRASRRWTSTACTQPPEVAAAARAARGAGRGGSRACPPPSAMRWSSASSRAGAIERSGSRWG